MKKKKYILITGVAGFIGFHLALKLIKLNFDIIGIDNINSYYSKRLKLDRLKILQKHKSKFKFFKIDLKQKNKVNFIFKKFEICKVYHLAAQAGVRKSIKFPHTYLSNNIMATTNLFEVIG